MARVVVLGAGISGHTAALHLRRLLDRQHEVVVVSPNSQWNWIPSNIWVGVGRMKPSQVTFPLKPVYDKHGVDFRQAKAVDRAAFTIVSCGLTQCIEAEHEGKPAPMDRAKLEKLFLSLA